LSREYEILMPVSNGSYSFVAWAGVNDAFTTTSFTKGVTTKKDLMLTLKLAEGLAPNLSATRVWQGESETVFLPNPDEQGSFYEHTAINLKEITNRLTVSVEIDSSVKEITPRDLTISVSSANGNINIDGTMPITNPLLTYPTIQSALTDNSVTWNFALMDLKTGYQNRLKIDYPAKEQTLFDGDLIGSILLNTIDSNINLECENDFVVKFVLKDYCETCGTHFSCEIYVNNWRVHSYETELGI
ncbi:FimB/Mfa2 family fimbrial subunit, partial [uncultured Bacteroides sp.]|uniref:FimB/Mfa2 family fimbrial subunit n=1 Tax=uncultured Bacteroides sp. TaxID=162156 RepID=UPI0026376FFE